ncbi:GGDEF domain-containing protein [Vibrio coralliilyticus]|uniref:GGDEF domain-containing protein n=1 Tax=Vibrio coralliilyticus TaxID=190893 RepID=UPI000691AA46|nr:GGDEF domain-containing protein [Vibrio coralliilyticus]
MLAQTALLYTSITVTTFAFCAALFIQEPVGERKAKPFYLSFYLMTIILLFWVIRIPEFKYIYESIFLDIIFGLYIVSLSIGISIRYKNKIIENIIYILLPTYIILSLIQIWIEIKYPINFFLMVIISSLNIYIIYNRKPKPNRADFGLIITMCLWFFMSAIELRHADNMNPQSYFSSDMIIFQLMFFPTTIFGITIFLLASYLMDNNILLEKLATKDELTNMLNRRALFDQISSQVNYLKRKHSKACVIIADIDHFKRVNDTYGHEAGDQVIKKFASIIKSSTRIYDISSRYGGEEFLIFLPNSNLDVAQSVTERILDETRNTEITYEGDVITFTASFGVCEYDFEQLSDVSIANADKALYHAKHSGRNQMKTFPIS